ncbi:MAG: DUF456 family protein [Flavobacteriia bacterium]|nr:DUF456 family protein [Flavobacteriia bacterium]
MELLIIILFLTGIVGAVLPVLPGSLITAAALVAGMYEAESFTINTWIWVIVGIAVFVADYGLITGPFMIVGALLGAFIGEYIEQKDAGQSLKSAFMAVLGLFTGIVIKLVYTIAMPILYYWNVMS